MANRGNPLALALAAAIHGGALWLVLESPPWAGPDRFAQTVERETVLTLMPLHHTEPLTRVPRHVHLPAALASAATSFRPRKKPVFSTIAPAANPTPPASTPIVGDRVTPSVSSVAAEGATAMARLDYEELLFEHIRKFMLYPETARLDGQQGTVHVHFEIDRRGTVLSASIDQSSGASALDATALDMIRRAQPFPPIPTDLPDRLEISLPVDFALSTREVALGRQSENVANSSLEGARQ